MIITKQLDIQGSDKTSSVSAATPRTNLVKELEKYSRHSESVEKRTTVPVQNQEKSDAVSASFARGSLLLEKAKVNKPVAKERPNILSKRPRFRPQQRSSSTDSSSSTSSLSSQTLNLATSLEAGSEREARLLNPEETPISAAAALSVPSQPVVTSIPTPSAITVTKNGKLQLMVPVTTKDIIPASSDDLVVPAGNGYVVYKPADQVVSKSTSTSVSVNSAPRLVSLFSASTTGNSSVTLSRPLSATSLTPSNAGVSFSASMPPPQQLPVVSKVFSLSSVLTTSAPYTSVTPALPVSGSSKQGVSVVSKVLSPVSANTYTPAPRIIVSSPPTRSVLNHGQILPSVQQSSITADQIRVSLRHKIDKNSEKEKCVRTHASTITNKCISSNTSSSYANVTKTAEDDKVVYYRKVILPSSPPSSSQSMKTTPLAEGNPIKIPVINNNQGVKSFVVPVHGGSTEVSVQIVPACMSSVQVSSSYLVSSTNVVPTDVGSLTSVVPKTLMTPVIKAGRVEIIASKTPAS